MLKTFWRYGTGLSLAVVGIAGIYWYASLQKARIASHEDRSDLRADLERYRAAGDDRLRRCDVANDVAASRTDVWEACSRKIRDVEGNERIALAHIASAYYKRGPRQKDELVSLFHSPDAQLVLGLLTLLNYTVDLGPNGEWQMENRLGGAEMARLVAGVYNTHPTLTPAVATTLGIYGSEAKGVVDTLLRIILSQDRWTVYTAKIALREIDFDGVYSQFGLDPLDAPLTEEQRIAIVSRTCSGGE